MSRATHRSRVPPPTRYGTVSDKFTAVIPRPVSTALESLGDFQGVVVFYRPIHFRFNNLLFDVIRQTACHAAACSFEITIRI